MFERYTEKARRVIFFARFEACQYGSPYIETEHLLLGLFREDRALARFVLGSPQSIDTIRKEVEAHVKIRERIPTTVEVPLTNECKRILNAATEESDQLKHRHVGTEHLLLGILCEEKCFAARILQARGVELQAIRERLARHTSREKTTRDIATIERVRIEEAVTAILDAWGTRDARRFSSLFEGDGQFWDIRRDVWLGRSEIEKGVGLHFSSSQDEFSDGKIDIIKLAQNFLATVTVVWERKIGSEETRAGNLRMTVVMAEKTMGWSIISASLAETEPSR